MLMRKHLTGGRLLDVRMEPGDRIVYFEFQCTNEMGDLVRNILCAELMGRYSNLVLVQNGKIIAALKRDTIFDTIATIISVIGVSVPSYVFALALSYTFGFKLRWFPMLFSAKDVLGSSVLPSVSLSMFTMASIARFTRSEMIATPCAMRLSLSSPCWPRSSLI